MSLDYSNLRALFHEPGPIPRGEFARDHDDYVVKLERRFAGSHGRADCLFCQLQRNKDNIPLNDPHVVLAVKWLEESPYNPFNGKRKFDHWLNCYVQALKHQEKKLRQKKKLRFANICKTDIDLAFFALLRKADIEEIERRIDVQAYPDIDEMYFLAGLYKEERGLPSWQKRKGERISLGLIDYAKAPAPDAKDFNQRLEQAVRADTTTREHQNRLCDEFQQAGMIGNSNAIVQLYLEIEQLCKGARKWPGQVPALYIYGKPGTGKERVAHGIHRLSRPKGEIVTCNCAAFPAELIESELFGHVKGAYTGAQTSKEGLFKQASGGTFFLDEINKMGLNQQGKLLRALEYGEIRKVGSNKPEKVDVLTVVAANVDLDEQVKKGEFLSDLRSRLIPNPISVPPLRCRARDVPLLVKHFLESLPGTPLEGYRFSVALWCMEKLKQLQGGFEVRDLLNEVRRLAFRAGPPEHDGLAAQVEAVLHSLSKNGEKVSISELARRSKIDRRKFSESPLRELVEGSEAQGIVQKQKRPPRTG